ncbi:MAG: glycosyltransferase family 2 protein [Chitinophagales bacterium]|nr:glycosyltransferase family 2 protein [Chitinophagales bacterium]
MSGIRKVAVLLTCHNRREKTLKCLTSFFDAIPVGGYHFDFFLVDDGSTDGTSDVIKNHFPEINIITGTGNLFWNRGMHLAWNKASQHYEYDYYLWLNDDVQLFHFAISELLQTAQVKPNSIISGTMRAKAQKIPTYGGWGRNGIRIVPNGHIQSCHYFGGNLVLIPKNVFEVVGNLDPIFPHAIGDFDYALRAFKQNIDRYICPNYSGICDRNPTPPKWCLPELPLLDRLKILYSPLGNSHPIYFFRFEFRHYGIFTAVKHFCSIHLRLIYPKLWMK